MANVDWGQEVRPSVHDLIAAVNELESYTDVEREVTGTFLERITAGGLQGISGDAEIAEILGNTEVQNQQLLDTHVLGMRSKGFNQWDEEWELGSIGSDGQPTSSTNSIRSKNFIEVLPTTAYYVAGLPGGILRPVFYDANKNFISLGYWMGGTANNPQNTPSNCRYMKFSLTSDYGATYKNDICINVSNTKLNGIYKPYWAGDTLEFAEQTLRGINTAQDVMTSEGIERHIGIANETSAWRVVNTSVNSSNIGYVLLDIGGTGVDLPVGATKIRSNISVGTTTWSDSTKEEFACNGTTLFYRFPTTTPVTLDKALASIRASDAVCEYILATPTTEQFAEPIDLAYSVEAGGTETWIVPTGNAPTSTAPAATIRYKMEYEYELITEKTFDNFCDALGTALNLNIAKEWNATTKEWDFTITQATSSLSTIRESEVAEIEEPIEWVKGEVKPDENEVETIEPVEETEIIEPVKEGVENE